MFSRQMLTTATANYLTTVSGSAAYMELNNQGRQQTQLTVYAGE